MRNKSVLSLMELLIMLLVFALAAALCLKAFALSDRISAQNHARDQAVLQAQNAAEVLQFCRGDLEEAAALHGGQAADQTWTISFDIQWEQTDGNAAYLLTAVRAAVSGTENGHTARIRVTTAEGQELFYLDVGWQEVAQ